MKNEPGKLYEMYFYLQPESIFHKREIFNAIDLVGELGGVIEIFIITFSVFLGPISYFSFILKATKALFLARTDDHQMFKPSTTNDFSKGQTESSKIQQELDIHRIIRISNSNKFKLYLYTTLGKCFPQKLWSKGKEYSRLYSEGKSRIETMLDLQKIIQHNRLTKIVLENSLIGP